MFASGIVLRVTPVHTAVHNCKLAARITIPHFSVSSVRCFPKSDGEPANTTEPSSGSRALSLGSAARKFHGFLPFAHCNDREFCTSVSRAAWDKIHRSPRLRKGGKARDQRDSRIGICVIHGWSVFGGPTMLTTMTEEDWTIVLRVCEASRSRRGDKGRDDKKFLSALHYFVVHNITWRALPEKFGHWNSVWKRFWRLSRSGTFEAFFDALAAMSETAHLVQMFDSTVVRAHVSAAGAKGGSMIRRLAARVAVSLPRFT